MAMVPEITTILVLALCVCSGAVKPAANLWNAPWAPVAGSPHTVAVCTPFAAGFAAHFNWSGVIVTGFTASAACSATAGIARPINLASPILLDRFMGILLT